MRLNPMKLNDNTLKMDGMVNPAYRYSYQVLVGNPSRLSSIQVVLVFYSSYSHIKIVASNYGIADVRRD